MTDVNELLDSDVVAAFPEYAITVPFLARGGMKTAYLCNSDGTSQVLKIFRESLSIDEFDDDVDFMPIRLVRELKAMQALDHPGITKIVSGPGTRVIGSARRGWYAEPFYPGGTLAPKLGNPWPFEDTYTLAVQLFEAAAQLWSLKIVHRDIKPENIVFDLDGRPVLLDLGIALFTQLTQITEAWQHSPMTQMYSAPEQWEFRNQPLIDFRTDLFLLGVTLFEVATGRHPFNPKDPEEFTRRLMNGQPILTHLEDAHVPHNFRSFLLRLLADSPSRRYRTPALALNALRGAR